MVRENKKERKKREVMEELMKFKQLFISTLWWRLEDRIKPTFKKKKKKRKKKKKKKEES
jgi:uncharacterized metal-binding protein